MSARTARIAAILAGLAGLTAFVLLIAYHNLAELGELLARAGWGIGAVILIHIPQLFLCALAWRAAASPLWPRGTAVFLWARLVRESVSTVSAVHAGRRGFRRRPGLDLSRRPRRRRRRIRSGRPDIRVHHADRLHGDRAPGPADDQRERRRDTLDRTRARRWRYLRLSARCWSSAGAFSAWSSDF